MSAACRAGVRAGFALAALSVRLLPHSHPYRIFILSLVDSLGRPPRLR